MTATELTTSAWLQNQGFFIMSSVKFGRLEADLLAIKPSNTDSSILRRVHVEVSVSSRPWGRRKTFEQYEQDAAEFLDRKFRPLHDHVRGLFNADYERWLVLGKMAGGEEEEQAWKSRMLEDDVLVFRFDQVVREYVKTFATRPIGAAGEMLDILNELGLLNRGTD